MSLFHHHGGIDSEYITHFHVSHGDQSAGLAWNLRDGEPREVMVFRSAQGFVEEGVEPTGDDRQALVYRGSDTHVKLTDTSLVNNVAYYYSVFAAGDDGGWHLQLTDTVAPQASSHWKRAGCEDDSENLQRIIDMDVNTGVGYF
jgi:hypothetical protein